MHWINYTKYVDYSFCRETSHHRQMMAFNNTSVTNWVLSSIEYFESPLYHTPHTFIIPFAAETNQHWQLLFSIAANDDGESIRWCLDCDMLMPVLPYFTTWNGAWIARQIGTRIGAGVLAHGWIGTRVWTWVLACIGGLDLRLELGLLDGLDLGCSLGSC